MVWIGLTDLDVQHEWKWAHSNIVANNYTNWGPTEPNRLGERCVMLYLKTKQWADVPCQWYLPFICQGKLYFQISRYVD